MTSTSGDWPGYWSSTNPSAKAPAVVSDERSGEGSLRAAARVRLRGRGFGSADRNRHPGRHRDRGAGWEARLLELRGGGDHRVVVGAGGGTEHRRAGEGSGSPGRNTRWQMGRIAIFARRSERTDLPDPYVHRQHVAYEPPQHAATAALARSDRRDHRPGWTRPGSRPARPSDRPCSARQTIRGCPEPEAGPLPADARNSGRPGGR